MNAKEQIAQREQQIAKAQAEIAFLSQLPEGLNIESCFPCGGEWLLNLKGNANHALQILPPLAIEVRADNYGEPVAIALERLAVDGDPCFPVWTNNSGKTSWWSRLSSGEAVKVGLAWNDVPHCVTFPAVPDGYGRIGGHHSTFFKRKRATAGYTRAARPVEVTSRKWAEFFDAAGYTAAQKQHGRILQAVASRDEHIEPSDLPPMPAETLTLADEELVVLRSGTGAATGGEYEGRISQLVRLGNFWTAFTPKQAEELLAFANTMVEPLEVKDGRFCREVAKVACEAATEFVGIFVSTQRNKPDVSVIGEWVSAKVGYPVRITLRESRASYAEPKGIKYTCWVAVDKWMEDWSFTVPAVYDPKGFDWEYPANAEYEPSAPLFRAQATPE